MNRRTARLVRIRKRQRDFAAGAHAQAVAEHARVSGERDAIASQLERTVAEPVRPDELERLSVATAHSERRVHATAEAVTTARRALQVCAEALGRAEKVNERAESEHAVTVRRAERKLEDDLGSRGGR